MLSAIFYGQPICAKGIELAICQFGGRRPYHPGTAPTHAYDMTIYYLISGAIYWSLLIILFMSCAGVLVV